MRTIRRKNPDDPTSGARMALPASCMAEIEAEAARQERSVSWVLDVAWRLARADMRRLPSCPGASGARSIYRGDKTEKVSVSVSDSLTRELLEESDRQGRSAGWLLATAFRLAREQIRELPSAPEQRLEGARASARKLFAAARGSEGEP